MDRLWMDRGVCRDWDPDVWFWQENRSRSSAHPDALRLCGICPVSDQCLAYALSNRIEHGVWGGTTPKQRRALGGWPAHVAR